MGRIKFSPEQNVEDASKVKHFRLEIREQRIGSIWKAYPLHMFFLNVSGLAGAWTGGFGGVDRREVHSCGRLGEPTEDTEEHGTRGRGPAQVRSIAVMFI